MSGTRTILPNKLLKLAEKHFAVTTYDQAYAMALEEAKSNNKKEFGMDEIAPHLEKCLQPILMRVDVTNEAEYLKLTHWVEHHAWNEDEQSILYKCTAIQGMVSCLLPIIKEKQQQQKIIGKIIPISPHSPDFSEIISCRDKKHGANNGLNITILSKNGEHQTYTLKECATLGNTLAEKFSADVARKMRNIEQQSIEQSIDEKKYAKSNSKTIIAPAYLVLQNKKLRVASEWSNDSVSFKACELFGFKKRMLMAGTFHRELFEDLRILNLHCELGLELVVIVATYLCDFDLHLENFLLKLNTTQVAEKDREKVELLMKEFKKIIRKRQHEVEMIDDSTSHLKKRHQSAVHLEYLKNAINLLKNLGVVAYFHKIDHDSGFYRYIDKDRKIDFSTHRTSPLYAKEIAEVNNTPFLFWLLEINLAF